MYQPDTGGLSNRIRLNVARKPYLIQVRFDIVSTRHRWAFISYQVKCSKEAILDTGGLSYRIRLKHRAFVANILMSCVKYTNFTTLGFKGDDRSFSKWLSFLKS